MIDAWMKMLGNVSEHAVGNWNDANQTVPTLPVMPNMITPELAMPAASPVLVPALASFAVTNAAAAAWAGFWMGAPLAGAAAIGILTGDTASSDAKPARTTPKLTKPVTRKTAPKRVAPKTPVKTSVKKTSAAAAAGKTASAKSAPAKVTTAKVNDRPTGLDAPKSGKADDLKRISGIGPKLESVLNDLGIYHFEQIAAWTPKQVTWVDDYLRFKGRIKRDRWIAQAKTFIKEMA